MPERPFNPGSAWIEPKLYRFEGSPEAFEITVLRPWPDPRAWRKTSGGDGWKGCRPPIDLRAAETTPSPTGRRRVRNEHAAALTVPPEVREPISRLSPMAQWAVLSMAARVDGALDLIREAPALATGLAHSFRLRPGVKRPIRSARTQVRRKRRAIAGWLGFPETEASVKAIARLACDSREPFQLLSLRKLLTTREPWLTHIDTLHTEVLSILLSHAHRRDRLTLALLREIAALPRRVDRARAQYKVHDALTEGPGLLRRGRVPVLRSLTVLEEVTLDLNERRRRRTLRTMVDAGPFPPPPYPDQLLAGDRAVRLTAITDADQLLRHAGAQRNCLDAGNYFARILNGTGYAYELQWPTRAGRTRRASLFVDSRGLLHRHWGVEDLRLSCNRRPPRWLLEQAAQLLRTRAPARLPQPVAAPVPAPPPSPEVDERQLTFAFLASWPSGPYVEDIAALF